MKRGSRSLTGIVSVAVGLSVLAAAPASAENVMRWTSQGDALTLDPHSQNEGPTNAMNGIIYESLVTRDPALKLEPELAESWKIEDNGWVFKLRKGVKFHDGSDFTAEDVAFSFKRAMHKASDFKKQVQDIAEVKVIDDHTIKLPANRIADYYGIARKATRLGLAANASRRSLSAADVRRVEEALFPRIDDLIGKQPNAKALYKAWSRGPTASGRYKCTFNLLFGSAALGLQGKTGDLAILYLLAQ